MTNSIEQAAQLAGHDPRLGAFAADMMIAAGKALMVRAANPGDIPNGNALKTISDAAHLLHIAMIRHRDAAANVPASEVWRCCANLAAAAALLATQGDANWPYKPEEAGKA